MILPQPLAFIDVETTGTDHNLHEIIELGLVLTRFKDNELVVIDKLDLKILPKNIENADPIALRVNGYDEADWMFAVELEEALKIFSEKTKGAIFVAHNVIFDANFIETSFKKLGMTHDMHFHKIDTISMAFGILHEKDDINRLSLRALCQYLDIENTKAHSAFADAYATYELFKKLLNLK